MLHSNQVVMRKLSVYAVLWSVVGVLTQKYSVPDVRIEVFNPKGIRASIPDAPNLSLFVFQGHVNREIGSTDVGSLSGEILQPTNGRWSYVNEDVQLKIGDTIHYYVFVSVDGVGHVKDKLSYYVREYQDPSTSKNSTDCQPTATLVLGTTVCAGQVIFLDNFETLRQDVWLVEHKVPVDSPEYPFVSYQNLRTPSSTVYVRDGNLVVHPTLLQILPGFSVESIYSGTLDLFSRCTGPSETCTAQAVGSDVLPPVVSGRIRTIGFQFKYGTVEVRAKLPQGDWLYPDITLEPTLKKYGSNNFASGVLKVACALGNRILTLDGKDYSNKNLFGGPIMDFRCRDALIRTYKNPAGTNWGSDFHTYSMRWEPDRLVFSVDGEEWGRVETGAGSLVSKLPGDGCTDVPRSLLARGTKMAPFDEYFNLNLGVSAGGIAAFRDGFSSSGHVKPWSNTGRKAKLHFWEHLEDWYNTWNHDADMLVDYVKVIAL